MISGDCIVIRKNIIFLCQPFLPFWSRIDNQDELLFRYCIKSEKIRPLKLFQLLLDIIKDMNSDNLSSAMDLTTSFILKQT